jgi:hypothetical protein
MTNNNGIEKRRATKGKSKEKKSPEQSRSYKINT